MTFYNEHSKVWLSVDCIIFGFDEGKLKILIGMVRLVTNVVTESGKAAMDGAFWDATTWFW